MTQTVNRNSLYFNKYKYCIHISYPYLHAIRYKRHHDIDRFVDFRLMIQEKYEIEASLYRQGMSAAKLPVVFRLNELTHLVDEISRKDLHDLLDIIESIDADFRFTISCDEGYIYTNHLTPFDKIFSHTYAEYKGTREVQCDVPDGCIRVRNSTYKYRTYFSEQAMDFSQAEQLCAFLASQDQIRLSPSMQRWVNSKGQYNYVSYWKSKMAMLSGSYFVDHDDASFITLMSLISPIKVKKTLQIINDK